MSLEELESRDLLRKDLVWYAGLDAWVPAGEVKELEAFFVRKYGTPPPLPAVPRQETVTSKPSKRPARLVIVSLLCLVVLAVVMLVVSPMQESVTRRQVEASQAQFQQASQRNQEARQQKAEERRLRQQRINELQNERLVLSAQLKDWESRYEEAQRFHWFRFYSEKQDELRALRKERDDYLSRGNAIVSELQSLGVDVDEFK